MVDGEWWVMCTVLDAHECWLRACLYIDSECEQKMKGQRLDSKSFCEVFFTGNEKYFPTEGPG